MLVFFAPTPQRTRPDSLFVLVQLQDKGWPSTSVVVAVVGAVIADCRFCIRVISDD